MSLHSSPRRRNIFTLVIIAILIMLFLLANWVDAQQAFRFVQQGSSTPILSHPSGVYESDIVLTISAPSGQILFTTDGSLPDVETAAVYETPIVLRADSPGMTVIRARTVMPNGQMSDPVTASYMMGMKPELPVLSLAVETDALWDEYMEANKVFLMTGAEWERPSRVTYFDENGRIAFDVGAGVRLHGQASRLFDKKSFRLYFRDEYGTRRLNFPLFAGNQVTSFDNLVLHNGGQDSSSYSANWTLLRTDVISHLARETHAISTYNKPILLFFNGELMGVYNLRERMDETFFKDHFGLDGVEIVDSLYRNEDDSEAAEAWRALNEYADTHDLADPDHYAYIESQLNIENMIDHYILQMYGANTDWPHFNERVVRADDQLGRWHHVMWDVDYNLGLFPASSVDENMVTWVMNSDRPEVYFYTGLFRALMDNPQFRNQFLLRSADLLNTTLHPEHVQPIINSLAEGIRPDIGFEIARWSSSGNWEESILQLNQFAEKRPTILRQHYVDGFGLNGTAELTVAPSDHGSILLNESWYPERPFTGTYFQGTTIQLRAIPDQGFQLVGWQVDGEWITTTSNILNYEMTKNVTIAPVFEAIKAETTSTGVATFTDYHIDGWQTGIVCENSEPWLRFRLNETTDLRGWRLTDNDSPTGDDEGSLIFADIPELSQVPKGTNIKIVLPTTAIGHPVDDLETNYFDKEMILYATNPNLDGLQDIGFRLVTGDSAVLMAPTADGEQAIALVSIGKQQDSGFVQFGLPETAVSRLTVQYCP